MTTFGLLIFDEAEELDFCGPWEVFTASSMSRDFSDQVMLIAEQPGPVRCGKRMRSYRTAPRRTRRPVRCGRQRSHQPGRVGRNRHGLVGNRPDLRTRPRTGRQQVHQYDPAPPYLADEPVPTARASRAMKAEPHWNLRGSPGPTAAAREAGARQADAHPGPARRSRRARVRAAACRCPVPAFSPALAGRSASRPRPRHRLRPHLGTQPPLLTGR
jgi:hypothetical protein